MDRINDSVDSEHSPKESLISQHPKKKRMVRFIPLVKYDHGLELNHDGRATGRN